MAIDPSIALGFQMPQFNTPMQAQAQALNLKQLQQQTQLRQQEIQQGQNALADQQRMSALYTDRAKNIDPDTGLPTLEALTNSGASPAMIQKITAASLDAKAKKELAEMHKAETAQKVQKSRQDAIQQVREDSMAAYQESSSLGPKAAKEAGQKVFADGISGLKKSGMFSQEEAGQMQTEFDPVRVSSRLLGYKEQMALAEKNKADERSDRSQKEKERHDRATEDAAGRREDRLISALVDKNKPAISDAQAGLSGDEFIKTLPAGIRGQVKALGEGRMQLSDIGTRGNERAKMAQYVAQAYPDFDTSDSKVKRAIELDFAKGQPAKSLQSINAVTEHMETYRKLANALDNGDIQLYNKYKGEFEKATGKTLPNDIQAAAPIIGSEVVKAILPGGGGVAERADAEKKWNLAVSRKQASSNIDNVYIPLMQGQVSGLKKRYEGSGKKDFNDRFLTPDARKSLKIDGPSTASQQQAPAAAIEHLKANPSLKDAFKAKYGYLPEGV